MEIGDFVTRKKYENDVVFRIIEINDDVAILEGIFIRLIADAEIIDLVLASPEHLRNGNDHREKYFNNIINYANKKKHFITGKVLHLDGDSDYLQKSLDLYQAVGVFANGIHLDEKKMAFEIGHLLDLYQPDIIVITGHDSFNNKDIKDLRNYVNSTNFINVVKNIRKKFSIDDKFIIAGACQSHFEALIAAGSNFATSPKRVFIHALDPAIIAIKASYTPFNHIVSIKEIFSHSYIKEDGLGGIESYGKMRLIL